VKISDTWLQNVKPRPDRYDVTVTNRKGLMVRMHPSGTITFRFRYKLRGAPGLVVFGEYGKQGISLKRAFDLHTQARSELEQGLDPREEQEKRERAADQARAEDASAGTVAYIVDQFVHRRLRAERWDGSTGAWVRETKTDKKGGIKARKCPDAAAAVLKKNLVDRIGTEKGRNVTKGMLIRLLDEIVDRGSPVQANRTYSLFKQCFEFAAAKDLIPASPMAGVTRPGGEEEGRARTLNDDEIRAFWKQVDTAKMSHISRLALKLLLVTGQRRGEITLASWSHFDLEAGVWTIPKELSKNGKMHVVPLSPLALQIVNELHALTGTRVHVLPSQHRKLKAHASYYPGALSHAIRKNEKHFAIAHFTTHDFRRTATTLMISIGVPRLHVKRVLNHTVGDITEIYDRHAYFDEKQAALDRWADHLQAILANKSPKVVSIRGDRTATVATTMERVAATG
jgi:integrase